MCSHVDYLIALPTFVRCVNQSFYHLSNDFAININKLLFGHMQLMT
jgi:hypothetical protein